MLENLLVRIELFVDLQGILDRRMGFLQLALQAQTAAPNRQGSGPQRQGRAELLDPRHALLGVSLARLGIVASHDIPGIEEIPAGLRIVHNTRNIQKIGGRANAPPCFLINRRAG